MSGKSILIGSTRKKENKKCTTTTPFQKQEIRINPSSIVNHFDRFYQFVESKNYRNKGIYSGRKIQYITMWKKADLSLLYKHEIKV